MTGKPVLIAGCRIIDPASKADIVGNILIAGGKVARISSSSIEAPEDCIEIEARGLIACPGFIDIHCHLREPGFEDKETIASGSRAAAKGGYTTVCCMPNTEPPLDNAALVESIKARSIAEGLVRLVPIGCLTRGRKGKELSEMAEMVAAGVAGFSDDGDSVSNPRLMRHAMEYSRKFDLPIIEHCEDAELAEGGVMNEGLVSIRLGLRGIPNAAEDVVVARDIALAELTGARLHIAHISTAGSVDLVRRAKEKGLRVTAEVTPHHLVLTEDRVMGVSRLMRVGPQGLSEDAYDTFAKVNPPLRSEADRAALVGGLKDGTIDAIATDHAPHTWMDKACEFGHAAFGISSIETAFGVLLGLVQSRQISLPLLISKLTYGPAQIIESSNSGLGRLSEGSPADIVIFALDKKWKVDPEAIVSKGKNNPYVGMDLQGKVMTTIFDGRVVYRNQAITPSGEEPE